MQKKIAVFGKLGDFNLSTDTLDVLEEFTYHLNGHVKQNEVHEVIQLPIEEKTKPNCVERPLENMELVEPTFLPCRSVIAQHIKQAWYIVKLHKSALEAYYMNETPIDYGSKLFEGSKLFTVK